MDRKIDWSKILTQEFVEKFSNSYIENEKKRHEKCKEYMKYQLFTPFYIKFWNFITLKKTPKL